MRHELDGSEIIELTPEQATDIHARARQLLDEPGQSSAEWAERGAALAATLPGAAFRALHWYRNGGSSHNALLVRGLLPELSELESTPNTTLPRTLSDASKASCLTLLAVLSQLGEPYTFASLYEGRLVQHVLPVPGQENAQTSEGSEYLAWHVEDAFTALRCDVFGLLCLRGAQGAATLLSPACRLDLPGWAERVLRQPRFVVEPDSAHGGDADNEWAPVPVLTGPAGDPELCFDAVYQHPADHADAEAGAAWSVLAAALEQAAVEHVLAPGELLIADNRRVAHARTQVNPRYDGQDRWLLRSMACSSVRAHRRRGADRALM